MYEYGERIQKMKLGTFILNYSNFVKIKQIYSFISVSDTIP